MKNRNKAAAMILCAAFIINAVSACGGTESTASTDDSSGVGTEAQNTVQSNTERKEADLTGATVVTLSDGGVSIDGGGASESGGCVTVNAGGTYVFSGTLTDGRIIVNASGEDVTLVLNGASITCSYGSPVYIYKSASTAVQLMEGTENTLTDGESYTFADSLSSAAEDEPNACLYSKSDLVIQGSGALTVHANYNNGITSKDTLEIYNAVISVDAVNHGINGKDSNTISGASVTVTSGGDAVRSSNDSDSALGWVSISDSTLELTAGEDGIQAETWASVSGGNYTITTGGGSGVTPDENVSAKGIKAGTDLTISGGVYTLDCSDDALHTNGDAVISGGVYTISTGDDGIHADGTLTVTDGQIDIIKSYEGLEGSNVDISGGEISIVSADDGVNAAGGADMSGFAGHGMGNAFTPFSSNCSIAISGGMLNVTAGGDGIDSNGTINMTGGTVLVGSTGSGDSALDYDGGFTLNGGVLLAACTGNMAQAPTEPEQYTVSIQFDTLLPAGTYISFTGAEQEFVFCLNTPAGHLIFSTPELKNGNTYSVSYGGTYSGENNGGLCTGGVYSGGTFLTELTISNYLTTYGQVGMGGSKGGGFIGDTGKPGGFGRNGMGR